MLKLNNFHSWLNKHGDDLHEVVNFDPLTDQVYPFDFTAKNKAITDDLLNDTAAYSTWVNAQLADHQCKYGIGGYDELRTIYSRSTHFDDVEEPRRLHLGTDIWGAAGTAIFNFYDGQVHSFSNNDRSGDYGATIIMKYELVEFVIYALYGHLSLSSLEGLYKGKLIKKGQAFAEFGIPEENGNWPPHLHFQLIFDLQGWSGDYPGVCKLSERSAYLKNCPDPNLILRHTFSTLS